MKRVVALVEDNEREAETVLNYFSRLSAESDDQFEVVWHKTGGDFLSGYKPVYDMVLLDINLTGINGMEVAKMLRNMDSRVVLIFVTSLAQYAVKGYEVSALDFIVKPLSYATFKQKTERALAVCMKQQDRDLFLKISDGIYRTSPSRIKYIEILGHDIYIHTTEGNLSSYGTLKQLEAQLDPDQFVRCNRSYLVNLAFVRAIHGSIAVVDRDELTISRSSRKRFLEALTNYLGGDA